MIDETESPETKVEYLSHFKDDFIHLGTDLEAMVVETINSAYNVIIDGSIVLVWKRGSREVLVDRFVSMQELFAESPTGSPSLIQLNGCEFTSSHIVRTLPGEHPTNLLEDMGKKPGDRLEITHLSGPLTQTVMYVPLTEPYEPTMLFDTAGSVVTKIFKIAEGDDLDDKRGAFENGPLRSLQGSYNQLIIVPNGHNSMELPAVSNETY